MAYATTVRRRGGSWKGCGIESSLAGPHCPLERGKQIGSASRLPVPKTGVRREKQQYPSPADWVFWPSEHGQVSSFPAQHGPRRDRSSLPQSTEADPGSSAPVRSVRTHNPMCPINFSANRIPEVRPSVGIGSVRAIGRERHRKSVQASSASRRRAKETRVLIVPWSQVRVLEGPPSPLEIIAL
jgi:hypothetical protein